MSFFTCDRSVDFLRLVTEEGDAERGASFSGLARVTGLGPATSTARSLMQRGLVVVVEGPGGAEVRLTECGRQLTRDLAARGWPTTGDARSPIAELYKRLRIRI